MKRQVEQLNQFIMDFISVWSSPVIQDEEECIMGVAPCGQLAEVSLVSAPTFSPLALMWMLVFALLFLKQRR
jgi:hypothetical protein